MKKICLIILTLTFLTNLKAQQSLNVEVGGLYSSHKFSELAFFDNIAPRFGYYLGLLGTNSLNDKWYSNLALQFTETGYINNDLDQSFRFNHLRLRPTFEYKISNSLSFNIGTDIGLNVRQQFKSNQGWIDAPNSLFIKKFDLGIILGARYDFNVWFISLNYNHGLINQAGITFTDDQGNILDITEKSRRIQFGIGYQF